MVEVFGNFIVVEFYVLEIEIWAIWEGFDIPLGQVVGVCTEEVLTSEYFNSGARQDGILSRRLIEIHFAVLFLVKIGKFLSWKDV